MSVLKTYSENFLHSIKIHLSIFICRLVFFFANGYWDQPPHNFKSSYSMTFAVQSHWTCFSVVVVEQHNLPLWSLDCRTVQEYCTTYDMRPLAKWEHASNGSKSIEHWSNISTEIRRCIRVPVESDSEN